MAVQCKECKAKDWSFIFRMEITGFMANSLHVYQCKKCKRVISLDKEITQFDGCQL